ncbi:MAG: formylglycine-generating enzyme family protein, partial [Planctomycetes bacterium]|nr:formylglycine-generating enzyme family protein [Planctomycetota bacterium]
RTVELGDGVTLSLVLVPPGEFVMGGGTEPTRVVKIDRPFWIAQCEVSNEQFLKFDPTHDSHVESKNHYQFGVHGFPADEPKQPVVRVSWQRASDFCRWLSERTGARFSLPTEEQWEYACRAGAATPFHFGDADADFSKFANLADKKLSEYASNPYAVYGPLKNATKYDDYIPKDTRFDDGGLVAMPIGSYQPNAWGLHDMHGNVWEWTLTALGDHRVVRGGSWYDRPYRSTAAYRITYPAWQRVFNVGFRVVCEATAAQGNVARSK